jgi:ferredoxin
MKIEVDLELCEDQAVCMGLAPTVFAFGEDGVLTVLQESPSEELREACEQAEAACPMGAIRLVE